ncbi:ligase-associated DNA damage response endonuclease PdeM [Chryseobacterium sp. POL2]|uniref:ligase-associated DNA damage response endonuclease PdeM n=1 Tax=Chryseobacterium sp. POL2 TaxID=2713414 RepID=UPI0013E13686|nr:ligase-associated DNA damage response endonuclease PdeM [Chryseobacterium sp. POL2]QIG89389.1 ligase-associated DNA damage response endonuclease PdeM [Chryseobacterium sp. POL2]
MNLVEKEIIIRNHHFVLTNQRALFWKNEKSLIISDLHLGKTAHFRKNGIALPADIIHQDLQRLSYLIEFYICEKLIIVGDFIHAGKNSEFEIFKTWKMQFPNLKIILVKGNHDKISIETLYNLGVSEVYKQLRIDDFIFNHEDLEMQDFFVISGHIHPGVSLQSTVRKFLKFPCYIVSEDKFILPAFSSFTGLDTQDYYPNAQKYIFDDACILEL